MWKKDLVTGMVSGNEKDSSNIYIELHDGHIERIEVGHDFKLTYLHADIIESDFVQKYPDPDTLILYSIHVPKRMRNKGIFKNILSYLEESD